MLCAGRERKTSCRFAPATRSSPVDLAALRSQALLVVSHRKAVVDARIHDLSVGSVLKGVVTAVKPYGAFVDVGGMSGLLHISQISCDHISNVESVIPVGTQVCV